MDRRRARDERLQRAGLPLPQRDPPPPRGRGERRGPESVFEGVLDHGEREGWGLRLDPSVSEAPIWREHWAEVRPVVVKVAEDAIVLEAVQDSRGG
ncbi:MAG: hypothetical protein WKF95_18210 [Rubrobacter sp.]